MTTASLPAGEKNIENSWGTSLHRAIGVAKLEHGYTFPPATLRSVTHMKLRLLNNIASEEMATKEKTLIFKQF